MYKVLHIELGRNLYGGAKQVFYLIKGLYEKGIKNILLSPKGSEISKVAAPFLYKNYELSYLGDIDISFLFKLILILKKTRPDIVHIHSRRGADVWGSIGAFISKIPCVITRRVDNPEYSLWAKIKYSFYDKIVVISLGIKKVLIKEGIDPKKIVHIPSGIDFDTYQKKCNKDWFLKEFGLGEQDIPIGMIAQFIPRKGHRVLLEAALQVVKQEPNAKFLLFGKGPIEAQIRSQVLELGIEKNIIFAGFRDDLDKIFPCLYMVVHPALMEGLGVSLLQAQAAGIPVVATSVGGIPEIIKNGFNGYLVSPNDPYELAHKILDLIRDKSKAQKMGANGKKLIKENFSVDTMVHAYIDLYKDIIERS